MGTSVQTQEMATLSKLLQVTMLHPKAFERAVEQGYIVVRGDGTLGWTLPSVTLLAYFCGRMWSGDQGTYSRRRKELLWRMGRRTFPAAALDRLFGTQTLKQTRGRRKNQLLPVNHELVDLLFDAMLEPARQ